MAAATGEKMAVAKAVQEAQGQEWAGRLEPGDREMGVYGKEEAPQEQHPFASQDIGQGPRGQLDEDSGMVDAATMKPMSSGRPPGPGQSGGAPAPGPSGS